MKKASYTSKRLRGLTEDEAEKKRKDINQYEKQRQGRIVGQNRTLESVLPAELRDPKKPMSQQTTMKAASRYIALLVKCAEEGVSTESHAYQVGLGEIKRAIDSNFAEDVLDKSDFQHLFEPQGSIFDQLKPGVQCNGDQVISRSFVSKSLDEALKTESAMIPQKNPALDRNNSLNPSITPPGIYSPSHNVPRPLMFGPDPTMTSYQIRPRLYLGPHGPKFTKPRLPIGPYTANRPPLPLTESAMTPYQIRPRLYLGPPLPLTESAMTPDQIRPRLYLGPPLPSTATHPVPMVLPLLELQTNLQVNDKCFGPKQGRKQHQRQQQPLDAKEYAFPGEDMMFKDITENYS